MIAGALLSQPEVWGCSYAELISLAAAVPAMIAIPLGVFRMWRHFECHAAGCHRPGRFPHGHYKLCHVHHPTVPSDGNITQAHINTALHDGVRAL